MAVLNASVPMLCQLGDCACKGFTAQSVNLGIVLTAQTIQSIVQNADVLFLWAVQVLRS